MQRYKGHAILGVHVIFALLTVGLLALNLVKAEAALTNGRMIPLKATVHLGQ